MRELEQICDQWKVIADPQMCGKEKHWERACPPEAVAVPVPGIFQQVLGEVHGVVWYYRLCVTPQNWNRERESLFLAFEAVDYFCDVYADGVLLGSHEGAERPFSFRIPAEIAAKEQFLLAIRLINPVADYAIDGLERHKVPCRNIANGRYRAGACYNGGGITLPVWWKAAPHFRLEDIFLQTNRHTGEVTAEITAVNETDTEIAACLSLSVVLNQEQDACLATSFRLSVPSGVHTQTVSFTIEKPQWWSLEDPNVYDCTFSLLADGMVWDVRTVSTGFRDFVVRDGFFYLNDRRIFLKSAHTGNSYPGGVILPAIAGMEYKDFQLAKAAGFNCIRFIATCATPKQLAYCDRLGLMIYEECYASWYLGNSPRAPQIFHDAIFAMIRRDRNHPCVTIWGMLNEDVPGDAFHTALHILPDLRKIDPTRLVLLSSGRFDLTEVREKYTPDYRIGSVSNPGSVEWECVWGDEGASKEGRVIGDWHGYMGTPLNAVTMQYNRTMARESHPVFISETGVGSQLDVITGCAQMEQHGIAPENPDAREFYEVRDWFLADYARYGCEDILPPSDFLEASNRYNAKTREICFDAIRSNSRFCGYNVTGLLDHSLCGEGPITYFRDMKPGNYDAFAEGFASLRWCLFPGCGHVYRGETMEMEAVLAIEDALRPGNYDATLRILAEDGHCVWEDIASFQWPVLDREGLPAFAIPVYKKNVAMDFPAGKYTWKAYLNHGGVPAAAARTFYIAEPLTKGAPCRVAGLFLPEDVRSVLGKNGIEVTVLETAAAWDGALPLLVGKLPAETAEETARSLLETAGKGGRVTFLDPAVFADNAPAASVCPLRDKLIFDVPAWVYHMDCAMKATPYTEGIRTGFMDWTYYTHVYPHFIVESTDTPLCTAGVAFEVGNFEWVSGKRNGIYHAGVFLGEYALGKGRMVLSTMPLLENAARPVAERMLCNLARVGNTL